MDNHETEIFGNFHRPCLLWIQSIALGALVFNPLGAVGIRGFGDTPLTGIPNGSGGGDQLLEDAKKMQELEHHDHDEDHDHDQEQAQKKTKQPSTAVASAKTSAKKDAWVGEHSSFFAGFNYQASSIANMIHYAGNEAVNSTTGDKSVNPTMTFPPLMGVGISIGYKQFFGQKHKIGLRYFGFFDYNHSRFGVLRSTDNPFKFGNTTFTEKDSYAGQYYANLYTYGVGIDMLYNFYTNKHFIFGMALGVQFAGDSWATSIQKDLQSYTKTNKGKGSSYSPANFQFLVNFVLRAQFAKHNGIELGIKVPTITHRYFSLTNAQGTNLVANVRRLYAFQISYLRDF